MFDWDVGNLPKIARHLLTVAEIEAALSDPRRIDHGFTLMNGEPRNYVIAATPAGRIIVVVTTMRGGAIRVVTAYPASPRTARSYRGAQM
ncbi:MAG: BrnT family toxin [Dehalococcoidia bacterium]